MAAISDLLISTPDNMIAGNYINAQTGTSYTLAMADAGCLVTLDNGASISVEVPTNATAAFQIGTRIVLTQLGAGAVSVAGDVGVTVNTPSGLTFANQYDTAILEKVDTNTWVLNFLGGAGGGGGDISPSLFSGRLTLTTGVPVTTSDVTAATTVYFTPYKGNKIALYDGAAWQEFDLTEISIAVPATTDTNYDIFVYDSGGLTLEAVAWTNDTTRATALATQDGVYVKTGATGRRYVGSFRTTGVSGQTEDSFIKRFVWNYYNRVERPMRVLESTNSWTYTSTTFQQANASAANQLSMVIGVSEDAVTATVQAMASNTNTGVSMIVGIGLDITNGFSAGCTPGVMYQAVGAAAGSNITGLISNYRGFPGIGYHFLAWVERTQAVGTGTWYGDNNSPAALQAGIHGIIRG